LSAVPTASGSDLVETAAGTELAETASAMEPVKTGAPEVVNGDAEVDEDANLADEDDEAAPLATQETPSASAVVPEASAPVDEAVESSNADVAPAASKSAVAEKSQAANEDAAEDADMPIASAVSTGFAPSATPSGAASDEAQEIVPGFPAALLPNANGDIEGLASESSMAAPIVATAFPSLTALATGRSISASASGMRPSISLKDMSASAAGSSPTGNVHSAASKVTFAGVSVAALAFAGLLLL
jgi:hypothetical protein